MLGNRIYFPEGVTQDIDFKIEYWKFLDTPTAWDDTFQDDVTKTLHWVMIYTVVSNLFLKRGDFQSAQIYSMKAEEERARVQDEDYYRRQDCETVW